MSARSDPRMRRWACRSSSNARSAANTPPSTSESRSSSIRRRLSSEAGLGPQVAHLQGLVLALALRLLAQRGEGQPGLLGAAVGRLELLDPHARLLGRPLRLRGPRPGLLRLRLGLRRAPPGVLARPLGRLGARPGRLELGPPGVRLGAAAHGVGLRRR